MPALLPHKLKTIFIINALLLTLIGHAPESEGCVFPPLGAWKHEKSYDNITNRGPGSSKDLRDSPIEDYIDRAHLVFIGRPKLYPLGPLPLDPVRDYNSVRFKVSETLKGIKKSEYVYATRSGIIAILNPNKASDEIKRNVKEFREEEQEKIEYHHNDLFWDYARFKWLGAHDISSRQPRTGSFCGQPTLPMITKNQNYLVIVGRNFTLKEPIISNDDPLVTAVKQRIKLPARQMGPELSALEFMKKMDRLAIVKTQSCHDGVASKIDMEDNLHGEISISLNAVDDHSPSIEKLISKYYKETRIEHSCQSGQSYLVYGRDSIPAHITRHNHILGYRFARIEDGNVALDDIATHLNLSDETLSIDALKKHINGHPPR